MTPLAFEQRYQPQWDELQALLLAMAQNKRAAASGASRARLTQLYRHTCEHLAIARARAYPAPMLDHLDDLTRRAHQRIYHRADWGLHALRRLVSDTVPTQMRAHLVPLLLAACVFFAPMLIMGAVTYWDPAMILSVVDAQTAANINDMYDRGQARLGRSAETDWEMFGFYIMNNVGIAFQCFASGLFLGLGSLFFLAFNGVLIGAVAGYLSARGLGENFFSFVITHSAFELTAIVLSGAAGLRLGYALLAPGRRTRARALVERARETINLIYVASALLLIAAGVEAFWSSAGWIAPEVKYATGALAWTLVLYYLCWPGRANASGAVS